MWAMTSRGCYLLLVLSFVFFYSSCVWLAVQEAVQWLLEYTSRWKFCCKYYICFFYSIIWLSWSHYPLPFVLSLILLKATDLGVWKPEWLSVMLLEWFIYQKTYTLFVILILDLLLISIFQTIFFLWFALSGWLFRVIIVATWVLPIAGPLLIGAVANNFVIKVYYTQPFLFSILRFSIWYIMFGAAQGECPACKRQFIGYKNQVIRCEGCRNIVWQPQGDFFSRDGSNNSSSNNKGNSKKPSKSQIIDVDFEEKWWSDRAEGDLKSVFR